MMIRAISRIRHKTPTEAVIATTVMSSILIQLSETEFNSNLIAWIESIEVITEAGSQLIVHGMIN